ncbi:MAG: hypothetical protein FJZ01_21705 [Candidatus Sericytochromatia bacterium]|nr:hypothetical protein [Candidatus Tanganyikabacteria bacterium]
MSDVSIKNTPYQAIKNTAAGKFVRDNKITTAGAVLGSALVVAGGAAKSEAFRKIAEKGIVPAVGAGVAGLGATMVHDSFVNDFGKGHNARGTGKAFLGTAMALGGTEIVGRIYDIPVAKQALSKPVSTAYKAIDGIFGKHWATVGGVALAAGGAGVLGTSVASAAKDGPDGLNVFGIGAGATMLPAGAAVLAHTAGQKAIAETAGKAAGAIGGAGLAAWGVNRGFAAVESVKAGKVFPTMGNATLAVTATGGGVLLAGQALGIKSIERLGSKILTPIAEHVLQPVGEFFLKNPILGGAIVVGGVGASAYYYFKDKK